MTVPKIKRLAVLIGFDPDNECVYSEILDLGEYYDGEHIWDKAEPIKKLRLRKVCGFLFDAEGVLCQEFESIFNLTTGIYESGFARLSDGTVHRDEIANK